MPIPTDWLLTAERVAIHLPTQTVVVADPHLGYGEARRRRGDAVPDESVAEQLKPLATVLQHHAIRRLVVAGDLLEDVRCRDALMQFERWLRDRVEWLALVPGNHDADLAACVSSSTRFADQFSLVIAREIVLGDWRVVHGDGFLPEGRVVHGHEHPYLRWTPKRRAIRLRGGGNRIAPGMVEGPCYLVGPERLILPAFSQEAAGVNVLSLRRYRTYRCQVVAGERVLDLGELASLRRRLSAAVGNRPLAD